MLNMKQLYEAGYEETKRERQSEIEAILPSVSECKPGRNYPNPLGESNPVKT